MGILIGISGRAAVGKTTAANIFVNRFNLLEISFADPIKRAAMEWWGFSEDTLWGPSSMRNKPDLRYPIEILDSILAYEDAECLLALDKAAGISYSEDEREKKRTEYMTKYMSARMALQGVGDKVRQIDPDVWLRLGINLAKKIIDRPSAWSYDKKIGVYPTDHGLNPSSGVVFSDCRYPNEMEKLKDADAILIRIKRPGAGLKGTTGTHASEIEQLSVPDSFFDIVIDNCKSLQEFNDSVVKAGLDLGIDLVADEQLELPWT